MPEVTEDTVLVRGKAAEQSCVAAAALPLAGAAAVAAVDAVDPQPGQVVFVNGASGGVGSYVIQLLAARGATVVATGTAEDTGRLAGLGAGFVVNHMSGPFTEQVRAEYPEGVDALIDLVSYAPDLLPLDAVRDGGTVASSVGAADPQVLAAAGLTGSNIMASPVREVVGRLADQAADGTLQILVASELPLERATEGLATIAEGRAHGKIVVTVDD